MKLLLVLIISLTLCACATLDSKQKTANLSHISDTDAQIIRESIDENKVAIYTKYQRLLRVKPDSEGSIIIRIQILKNGMVNYSKVAHSDFNNSKFEKAVIDVIKNIQFSALSKDLTINYTFEFKSK